MTYRALKFSVAALGAILSTSAHAQSDETGVYGALRVGYASVNDTSVDYSAAGGSFGGTGTTDTLKTEIDLAGSVAIGGTVGYDFGRFRADVEVDYSRNRIRSLAVKSLNGTPVTSLTTGNATDVCDYIEVTNCTVSGNRVSFANGGKVRQLSALVNLWVDLPVGETITPYVGGGVGVGGFEFDGEGKATFAFQLGAGAAFRLSNSLSLTADYRYRQISGSRFTDSSAPGYALDVGKFRTSTFSAGLRVKF